MRKEMSLVRKIFLAIGAGLLILFISVIGVQLFSGYGKCPMCGEELERSALYVSPKNYSYLVECPKCSWMTSVLVEERKDVK